MAHGQLRVLNSDYSHVRVNILLSCAWHDICRRNHESEGGIEMSGLVFGSLPLSFCLNSDLGFVKIRWVFINLNNYINLNFWKL